MEKYLHLLSRGDKIGLTLIRQSIAIVGDAANLLI